MPRIITRLITLITLIGVIVVYSKFIVQKNKNISPTSKITTEVINDGNTIKEYFADGSLFSEKTFRDTPEGRIGRHIAYHPNGKIWEDFQSLGQQRHGLGKWYTKAGVLETEQNYVFGRQEGITKWFYVNGVMKEEIEYINNQISGYRKIYDEEGDIKKELTYLNGVLNGIYRVYYKNGKVRYEANYVANKMEGPYVGYNNHGDKTYEFVYVNGDIKNLKFYEVSNYISEGHLIDYGQQIDAYTTRISLLFAAGHFDELEDIAKKLRNDKSKFPNGTWKLDRFYRSLADGFGDISKKNPNKYLAVLANWEKAYPESITQHIAQTYAYLRIAWSYRGTGYSNTVSQKGWEQFNQYLEKAWETIEKVEGLSVNDPELNVVKMSVALGLNKETDELDNIFEQAVAKYPYYRGNYTARVLIMLPQWRGSKQDIVRLAQIAAEKTKELHGDAYYARIFIYTEDYVREKIYEYPFDWDRLLNSLKELVQSVDRSSYFINVAARTAVDLNKQEYAQEMFSVISQYDQSAKDVWRRKEYFDRGKQWAQADVVDDSSNELHAAARIGDTESIVKLVGDGEDINARDKKERTPLHIAIEERYTDTANWLIYGGSDLSLEDSYSRTPLDLAADNGMISVTKKLLKHGANPDGRDIFHNYGKTPLIRAAKNGHDQIIQLLLDYKANINAQDLSYKAPLHMAVYHGHVSAIKMLLDHSRININLQDKDGFTPLHYAVSRGDLDVVKILIQKGVRTDIFSHNQKTAEQLATDNGFGAIAQYLQSIK